MAVARHRRKNRFDRQTQQRGGRAPTSTDALADAPRGPVPHHVRPMLATLTNQPFDRPGWLFELKWDGFRAIGEVVKGRVQVYSRNQKSLHTRFPPIVEALGRLKHDVVFDGEIVALDEHGQAQFQLLQNYQRTGQGRLAYSVFDLLYLDGHDLRGLPLIHRKELLSRVIPRSALIRYSDHVENDGKAFFAAAAQRGLEGIVAKNGASPYREATRSLDWLKVKSQKRQEAVIGGFTEPRRSRQHFGALLLGVYDGNKLDYIGHTGTGFNVVDLEEMGTRLRQLETDDCPFAVSPRPNAPAHWVEPKLVCEVKFQEWTSDGRMRIPVFLGLRDDKPARSVRREVEQPLAAVAPPRRHSGEARTTSVTRRTLHR
jgi:bifunctional non-homologous end joining protein LigD